MRHWALISLVFALLFAACQNSGGDEPTDPTEPETPSTTLPLRVSFDPEGNPYDESLPGESRLVREHLADLVLPSGRIAVAPGEALQWLEPDDLDAIYVDLGAPGLHSVEVVWLEYDAHPEVRSPAGLIIDASGGPVVRWGTFELAYGTDGGMGSVSTPEYHDLNGERTYDVNRQAQPRSLWTGCLRRTFLLC